MAVAATVMVLRLEVPERASLAAAGRQLPVLLAYLISYTQIFLAWHEHHDTFLRVERISHTVFLLNCLWLFFVTLLPFVTGVVGSSPRHTPSVLLYLAVLTAEEGSLLLLCRTLHAEDPAPIQDADILRTLRVLTLSSNALAAVCALWAPMLGLGIAAAVCVLSVILLCRYDRCAGAGKR